MSALCDPDELRNIPLFRTLHQADLDLLVRHAYISTLPPGVALMWQGQAIESLNILVSGFIAIEGYFNSKQYIFSFAREGCLFPIGVFSGTGKTAATARTVTRCRVVRVPVATVHGLLERSPAFAAAALRAVATMTERQIKQAHDRNLRTPTERLAVWVLDQQREAADPRVFTMPYGRHALAAVLGMSSATLGRCIEVLSSQGTRFIRSRVEVADPLGLSALANPTPHLANLR
jgi:CRP-like cAMP-binding protein